jgi:hypothetical protein
MPLTLGLTGMDTATETALKAAFTDANARLGGRWHLMSEAEAGHVMVDMDSMYGPMSWLRLHAAGKRVIGLTTAARTQTDFRLGRPFDSDSFAELLRAVATADGAGSAPQVATDAPTPHAVPAPAALVAPVVEALAPAPPSGMTPAPAPQDPLPEEVVVPVDVETAAPPEPVPEATPPPPARDPMFADWLAPGALSRRVRYRRATGPTVLIDPATRSYHGPATLKPFAAYFDGMVGDEDFETVDDAAWTRESTSAGPAQPLARLQWLAGLVAGKGVLLPELDAQGRYRLNKWPQTEREYPKHFRIATAMMKGPATVAEIAVASAMPEPDVADFINANLATGFAEYVPDQASEPAEAPKSTGLLGRLRGRG